MVAKITRNFRLHNAKQFAEQFSEADPTNIYFFIGNSTPWPDETNPPEPIDSTSEVSYDIWKKIIAMKRISPADVSFGVNRVEWTANTVYAEYTPNTEFHATNLFYVITEDYDVYKCLGNNNGSPSTVKPTGRLLTPLSTADGYLWKYMFTVSASDALKFSTFKFFPVKTLDVDDDSRQWQVQTSAIDGSVPSIKVTSGGSNYIEHVGTLTTSGSNNLRLGASASSVNSVYNNSILYVTGGTGLGQYRRITAYNGSTKSTTFATPFSPSLDTTSTYIVSPAVNITGDGTDLVAYSRVTGGQISRIVVINPGKDYTYARVSFAATVGSGASAVAYVSPPGGHGSNPVEELFAHNVIMNIKLRGNEANTFMAANDFRTIGLIADPLEVGGTKAAQATYNQNTILRVSNPYLTFTKDEVITASNGTVGNLVEYLSTDTFTVTNNERNFTVGTTLTGGSSGATATVASVDLPDLEKYTGRILYIENRSPTTRALDQEEDIKIAIRF